MAWWRVTSANGPALYTESDKRPREPAGGSVIAVPRPPDDGETWDEKAGDFVRDWSIAADMAVPAGHIEEARKVKYLEAIVILSGIELTTGLLADEAPKRGLSLQDMAQLVHDQARDFTDAERDRMARKTAEPSKTDPARPVGHEKVGETKSAS